MISEWKQNSTAGDGGRVQVVVPGLKAGDVVEVSVRFHARGGAVPPSERPIGLLKDQIRVMPDFDAPLEEFDEYL